MAATVKIDYRIGGEDAVLRSIKTILQATQQAGREQVKVAQAVARERVKAEKAVADAGKASPVNPRGANDNTSKLAAYEAKVAAKRLADRRREEKLGESINKAIEAEEKRHLAVQAQITNEKAKDAEKSAKIEERAAKRRDAVRAMEVRKGTRISQAMEFARIDDINHRRGAVRGAVGDAIKRGTSTGVGMLQAGAGMVGGYLGTQTVLEAGRAQLNLTKRGALLQNATDGRAGGIVEQSKSISNIVGEDAGDIMGGFERIAGKAGAGGLQQARGEFLELAKVAKGAGVEMNDLGDVVATLINRGIVAKDLVKTVESLVQQGKDGAVEFKDLATMLDASSGALGRFEMGEANRITTAGGLSQLARTYGKKSPEEATNAVEDLARDLGGKGDIVQRLTGGKVTGRKMLGGKNVQILGGGVEVGTDATRAQLKDVNTLLPDIIDKAFKNGNAGKLMGEGGIFTGNSTAIVAPLIQAYNKGITKVGEGPDARYQLTTQGQRSDLTGKAAADELLKQFRGGDIKPGASDKAFANVMATGSGQIEVAMNRLKNDLGDKLGPEIAKATPQITKFIETFGRLTIWAMSNPFKAMAGVIMASVAQSLIGAGASSLLDKLLSKAIPAMAVTAGTVNVIGGPGAGGLASLPAGAAAGVGMNAGTIVPALAAGAVGFGVGTAVAGSADKDLAGMDTRGAALESLSLAGAINGGKGTKADRERATALLAKMKEEQNKGVISRFGQGVLAGGKGLLNGDISVGNVASVIPPVALARGAVEATLGNQQAKGDDTTRDAIRELQQALMKPVEQPDVVSAVNNLGTIIQNANIQGPKVQP